VTHDATPQTAPGTDPPPGGGRLIDRLRPRGLSASQGIGLLVLLVGMMVYFSWASPFFLSVNNFLNIGSNISYIGIMAIAMTMVIVSGGFDLSVGAVVALTAVTVAKIHDLDVNIWIAVAAGFAIGPLVGLANGLLVTKVGINPLITTLGTMSIVRGMAFVLTGGLTGTILDSGFAYIGRGKFFEIPVPLIILLIWFLIALLVMTSTRFGRDLYSIGGNAEASRLAGIPVDRRKIAVYVISGGAASVAGIVLASQLGAGAPQSAAGVELTVITAVILGGTSLSGGKGTVWGTMLGVFIMGVLNNGLALLRVSSFYQEVFRGAVLLLAVAVDQLGQRRRR
jgi:ribose/xylose/arabinose/galactoside ABC-type transport system permease subunit